MKTPQKIFPVFLDYYCWVTSNCCLCSRTNCKYKKILANYDTDVYLTKDLLNYTRLISPSGSLNLQCNKLIPSGSPSKALFKFKLHENK